MSAVRACGVNKVSIRCVSVRVCGVERMCWHSIMCAVRVCGEGMLTWCVNKVCQLDACLYEKMMSRGCVDIV